MAQDNNMTNENLAKALKVLRSFNGAYDEYADEIERLQRQLNFANREPPHCSTCSCGQHEPGGSLRTPQDEPALTPPRELPGTREPVSQQPHGNAGESPALFNCGYDPTSHGWVVREGSREGLLVACFLREEDANGYVTPVPSPVPGYRVFDEVSDVPAGAWDALGKAATDAMTSGRGTGFVKVAADGVQHVPHAEIYEPSPPSDPRNCPQCGPHPNESSEEHTERSHTFAGLFGDSSKSGGSRD